MKLTVKDLVGHNLKTSEMIFIIEYTKDLDARRAAKAAGYPPDDGFSLREAENIQPVLIHILQERLDGTVIDAEWVLAEAVDNHRIARQKGNLSASNKALDLIARHAAVDAMSAEKVIINTDEEVRARLQRGRDRMRKNQNTGESFL